ncbi:MAG TPA: hypothetical protein VM285_15350 [Polyangia bacterium]|nr:hypothetical protein [Polyangia bacterium]
MPERLTPGTTFTPKIQVGKRALWLIVVYCDSAGICNVLLPSSRVPEAAAPAGGSCDLWPIEAVAAADGGEARERLVVFGFPEEGDYRAFTPPAGALDTAEASAYAKELEARLMGGEIPARRWVKAEFRYVIEAVSASGKGRN